MPWKPVPDFGVYGAACALQFGHGCDAVETCSTYSSNNNSRILQFGHGCDAVETTAWPPAPAPPGSFNSATAVMPWKQRWVNKTGMRASCLQFGHGCDAVETPSPHLAELERVEPSIRPRL